jgi:multidrug efflux pump subunit AcrA (membrane-fusion protein)
VEGVEGPFVYTANGSHFTRTVVRLGAVSDGWVEVVDGLYAGDSVVSKAADTVWMIELCALKGGAPCCPAPMKK